MLIALLAVACGHARPTLSREPLVATPPLAFREIELRVGDEVVPFILVTEGSPPTLPLDVARRAHLSMRDHSNLGTSVRARSYYVDYYGNVHADIMANAVRVRFPSGQTATLDLQLIGEGAFSKFGTVAPQDLVDSDDAFILDFSKNELRVSRAAQAIATFRADHPDAQSVDFRSCGTARAVGVQINGVKTFLQVATGATATFLSRNSPVVAAMSSAAGKRMQIAGAMGNVPGFRLGPMPIELAGERLPADVVALPTLLECRDFEGSMGMDVLKNCALAWSKDALWMSCHAEPPRGVALVSPHP